MKEVSPSASRIHDANDYATETLAILERQGDMMKVTSWNLPNNSQVLFCFFVFCCSPAQSMLISYWCSHLHLSQLRTSKRPCNSSKMVIIFCEMKQKEGLRSTDIIYLCTMHGSNYSNEMAAKGFFYTLNKVCNNNPSHNSESVLQRASSRPPAALRIRRHLVVMRVMTFLDW